MLISVIPDTNVLIESLDVIKQLANDDHPYNIRIVVLSAVLFELDKLKKESFNARAAIDYLSKLENNRIYIEGAVNLSEMEVILEKPKFGSDNVPLDIIISSTASSFENSVILTYDKNMILFCKSKNVKSIYMEHLEYDKLKLAIYISHTDLEEMEVIEDTVLSDRKVAEECLKPLIIKIIEDEIGPGAEAYKTRFDVYTIEMLIDFIVKDFYLFENYIPKNSKIILKNIQKELKKDGDIKEVRKALQNILTIFRVNLKL